MKKRIRSIHVQPRRIRTGFVASALLALCYAALLCACGKAPSSPAGDTLVWKTEAQLVSQLKADDFKTPDAADWFRDGAIPLSYLPGGELCSEEWVAELTEYRPELWCLPAVFTDGPTDHHSYYTEPRFLVRSGELYAGTLSCFNESYLVLNSETEQITACLYVSTALLPNPWSAFGSLESTTAAKSTKVLYGDFDSSLCGNPLALVADDDGLIWACLERNGVRYEIKASGITQAEVETLLRSICETPHTGTSEPMEEILPLIGEEGLKDEVVSALPHIRYW